MRTRLLVALLVAGCGGTTAPSTTDGDAAVLTDGNIVAVDGAPTDFCQMIEARAARCGVGAKAGCPTQLACYNAIVRLEDRDALLSCFATRDCATRDDKCVADVSSKYVTDAKVSSYVTACNDKRTACSDVFSDDYCGLDHGLFNDGARDKLRACLDESCAEIKTCFDAVFASYGCK